MTDTIRKTALLLLIASAAFGQAGTNVSVGGTGGSSVPTNAQLATQGTLNLFVDASLGNDANACTASGASACLTIQGAVDKVPKSIRDPVTITLASGTYAQGAYIEGFSCQYTASHAGAGAPSVAQSPYIQIIGTTTAATITGLQTGTVAGATSGGLPNGGGPATWGTATVTAAGWAVNGLVGHYFCTTGGAGNGQCRVVESNTATVATIDGAWTTTPDATTTFAISDMGSSVTPSLSEEQSPIAGLIAPMPTVIGSAAFIVRNNNCANMWGPSIAISNVAVPMSGSAFQQVLREAGPGSWVALQGIQVTDTASAISRLAVLDFGAHLFVESAYVDAHTATGNLRAIQTVGQSFIGNAPVTSGTSFMYIRWSKFRGPNEATCVGTSSRFLYQTTGTTGTALQNSFTGLVQGFNLVENNSWTLAGNHWLASPAASCSAGYVRSEPSSEIGPFNNFVGLDGDLIDGNAGAALSAFFCRGGLYIRLGSYNGEACTIQGSQYTFYLEGDINGQACVIGSGTFGNGLNPITSTTADILFTQAGNTAITFPASAVPVWSSTACSDCCITEMATGDKVCAQ